MLRKAASVPPGARHSLAVWRSPASCGHDIDRSKAFVYQRINSGDIRAHKISGALRIHWTEWRRWVDANTSPHVPHAAESGGLRQQHDAEDQL